MILFIFNQYSKISNVSQLLKKTFDIFVASFVFLLALSPGIVISIISAILFNKKIFFIQKRVGENGKTFKLIKFISMYELKDHHEELLPDHKRYSRWGNFLRKYSLDEIPQLINVIKGDMSIVGPRPLLPEYLPLYSPEETKRHMVKPGLTSLAQIRGGNELNWDQRLKFDIEYIHRRSWLLDIKIIALTFLLLFFPKKHYSASLIDERAPKVAVL